jgi:6-phosphogluconate dehydrogenase (decarboxylating)
MQLGMIGLGRMGGNMVRRLHRSCCPQCDFNLVGIWRSPRDPNENAAGWR